jgi:16S rRNA (uracil1498-N3)-methyltransferase
MRRPRVHVEQRLVSGQRVALADSVTARLVSVLRLRDGAPVVLFDGSGHDWPGVLELSRGSATVALGEPVLVGNESPLQVTLAQAIARGEKMDLILQKASELGVARIVPIVTERTEVRLDAERRSRRTEHWRRVIVSACEQSGRARLPMLEAPVELSEFAAEAARSGVRRFALDPESGGPLSQVPRGEAVVIVVGPEGGLGDRDRAALTAAGFGALRLGPRILRTETAGLAALAALQALAGDFD